MEPHTVPTDQSDFSPKVDAVSHDALWHLVIALDPFPPDHVAAGRQRILLVLGREVERPQCPLGALKPLRRLTSRMQDLARLAVMEGRRRPSDAVRDVLRG